ncbi:DUF2971 domain-containing protein [Kordia sp. YSTF-M3]|uniref:DUF2971 domain-containing protein n=1 Tax=Kordia aestuariivivens TaxID=2759037 RepID=A0ABR7Q5I4_9FLAO|nr:DUF2971 domain-containing protein [Kordia aestuariivivens]MBC8753810.1 DUF2971 domain-containing protein [Kordia aestuariivivens]
MKKGIIYKYRNWHEKFHKNVLIENEIYLAPPNSFNDPFDCKIPENFHLIDNESKREEFANFYVNKHKEKLISLSKKPEIIKSNLKERLKVNLDDEHLFNEKRENEELDSCYGVFSGSKTWKSILMWSHYGDNHKGYCIGFKEELIIKSNKFGRGGHVNYSKEFPIRNPLDFSNDIVKDSFIQMYTKAEEWKYEEEYRLSILNPDGLTNIERIVKLDDNFISEVILGVSINEKDKNEIIEICKRKQLKVYQAKKIPFRFDITREEV